MAYIKVKELLRHATDHHYGVAAINVFSYESACWAVRAAEQEHVPIIIQLYPGFDPHIACRHVASFALDMAEKASVPVAVHLDHSASYEIAVAGIRDGFPSVMIDGSSLPFDENIAVTRKTIEVARIFGVDVEAELGHVGSGSRVEDITDTSKYTSIEEAVEFVRQTGCDSLAVAVGNAHGVYVQVPHLDLDRIKALRAALDIPLVLHGCSDIPDESIQASVNLGMSKFNIATEIDRAFYQSVRRTINMEEEKGSLFRLMNEIEAPVTEFIRGKLRLLNPNRYRV